MSECNETYEVMTTETFLRGLCLGYPLPTETLQVVALKQGITLDTDISMLQDLQRDMLEIEMLRKLLLAPGMSGSVQDSNGTWSHKEGAVEMNSYEKNQIKLRLNELEREYGLPITSLSKIKIHNIGMKVWH